MVAMELTERRSQMPTQSTDGEPDGPRRSGRSSWIGWIAIIAVIVMVIVGIARGTSSELAGASLASAIKSGDRPAAPGLPTQPLNRGDERIPSWYRPVRAGGGVGTGGNLWDGPLVVNFWTSWCGPCRDEAPALNRIQKEFKSDGVVVVGVNGGSEDTRSDARAFVREFKTAYPVVVGTAAVQRAWGVDFFPETYIVGRDGRISARVSGPIDEAELRRIIDQELERFPA